MTPPVHIFIIYTNVCALYFDNSMKTHSLNSYIRSTCLNSSIKLLFQGKVDPRLRLYLWFHGLHGHVLRETDSKFYVYHPHLHRPHRRCACDPNRYVIAFVCTHIWNFRCSLTSLGIFYIDTIYY